jgi:hypothetical protein
MGEFLGQQPNLVRVLEHEALKRNAGVVEVQRGLIEANRDRALALIEDYVDGGHFSPPPMLTRLLT